MSRSLKKLMLSFHDHGHHYKNLNKSKTSAKLIFNLSLQYEFEVNMFKGYECITFLVSIWSIRHIVKINLDRCSLFFNIDFKLI